MATWSMVNGAAWSKYNTIPWAVLETDMATTKNLTVKAASFAVTNRVLSGGVVTLTVAAHTFVVGDRIIVTGVGAPFDSTALGNGQNGLGGEDLPAEHGAFAVTAVTPTTISYKVPSVLAYVNDTRPGASGTTPDETGAVITGAYASQTFGKHWVEQAPANVTAGAAAGGAKVLGLRTFVLPGGYVITQSDADRTITIDADVYPQIDPGLFDAGIFANA